MDLAKLKKRAKLAEDSSTIYLIEALTNTSGFFASNGKLMYIALDIYDYKTEGIETEYLKLQTHIRISAVKNDQTFKDGYYNAIIYQGSFDDSNLDAFIQLCSVHSSHSDELNYKEFFYSLISLFQLPSEQSYKNAVGLYGELKFMEYALFRTHADVSNSWHKRGSYSQFDFSNGELSIEIKTTSSNDCNLTIKHNQIFGEYPCYLVAIVCDQYENGETINELISKLRANTCAFNGINYCINLEKELKRVSSKDLHELRFYISNILFFDPEIINPFPSLPENVSDLSYNLEISELLPLSESDADSIMLQF